MMLVHCRVFEVFISLGKSTGANRPTESPFEVALHTELLRDIDTATQALQAQIEQLKTVGAAQLSEDGQSHLVQLAQLRGQLAGGAKDAATLRATILSAVAEVRAYTSGARIVAATGQAVSQQAAAMALSQASEASHVAVTGFMDDYYKRRIFDPYLRFASTHDEEEYRRREVDRQAEIQKALAEKTPSGDLRANDLAIEQLKDAGAHGADRSPEYKPRLAGLEATRRNLAGQSSSKDGKQQEVERPSELTAATPAKTSPVPPDVLAMLRASNVAVSDHAKTGHGVTAAAPKASEPTLKM